MAPKIPHVPRQASVRLRLPRARSIRAKLARILVLSLAMVLILLGAAMDTQIRAYAAAVDTTRTVDLVADVQNVIQQAQKERGLTLGELGGSATLKAELPAQRTATDQALTQLRALLAADPPDATQVTAALGLLDQLPKQRATADAAQENQAAALTYFANAIAALNDLPLGLDQSQDPQINTDLEALYALGHFKEYNGRERALLTGVFSSGGYPAGEYLQLLQIKASQTAYLLQYQGYATTVQAGLLNAVRTGAAAKRVAAMETVAMAAGQRPGQNLTAADRLRAVPQNWYSQMTTYITGMWGVQKTLDAAIEARAAQLQSQALERVVTFAAFALLAAAAEILLALGALRSIIAPLGLLVREADALAGSRLPEAVAAVAEATEEEPRPALTPVAVDPHAGTEIHSVAAALGRVQESAIDLATEQAALRRNSSDSLVNLARRNQNLVRRQLGFISRLERDELEPTALANLFELDHLATRMRRNAESLLVLVGEGAPRRWAEPVPASDVVRAALAEVEDYRRVTLRRLDEARIAGGAVAELAHLLAELLENALTFSPPDSEVEILGRVSGKGYLIAVIDYGRGMTAEQMDRANRRLRGQERYDVAPTRFLGHYVVGRLAQRLGAQVQVGDSPTTGVTARILIPSELVSGVGIDAPLTGSGQGAPVSAAEAFPAVGSSKTLAADGLFADAPAPAPGPASAAPIPGQRPQPAHAAPRPAGAAPTPATATQTRNGLAKRAARGEAERAAARAQAPQPELPAWRSPEDVKARLTAFSGGYRRGATGTDTRGGAVPDGEAAAAQATASASASPLGMEK
ncbi:nitrate- and nitrite sensing domain-containing protein [Actinospica durhamensis]|uniref:histidine kinase n=1 Tax=Actinospica durhamensis TaxID=1508375 RepID=A0A941ERQ8_9ACTN|nr:ATP-binding protein [Actinospica durhamensis]MBR7833889.1 nitrate- and nitrite sensing domain-containing protein [Actinospica durhamensis]